MISIKYLKNCVKLDRVNKVDEISNINEISKIDRINPSKVNKKLCL